MSDFGRGSYGSSFTIGDAVYAPESATRETAPGVVVGTHDVVDADGIIDETVDVRFPDGRIVTGIDAAFISHRLPDDACPECGSAGTSCPSCRP